MNKEVQQYEQQLFLDIRGLIDGSKKAVSATLNTEVTSLYWNIGNRINTAVLENKRADYGKQIVATLSRQLTEEYGNNFEEKNLRRMIQFAVEFNDYENVATLW